MLRRHVASMFSKSSSPPVPNVTDFLLEFELGVPEEGAERKVHQLPKPKKKEDMTPTELHEAQVRATELSKMRLAAALGLERFGLNLENL